MAAPNEYKTKGQAAAYISMQTGYGMPTVERTMQRLQEAGRITPMKVSYAILYSPEDVDLVIRVLKGEER